jgi:hypothetical protein
MELLTAIFMMYWISLRSDEFALFAKRLRARAIRALAGRRGKSYQEAPMHNNGSRKDLQRRRIKWLYAAFMITLETTSPLRLHFIKVLPHLDTIENR